MSGLSGTVGPLCFLPKLVQSVKLLGEFISRHNFGAIPWRKNSWVWVHVGGRYLSSSEGRLSVVPYKARRSQFAPSTAVGLIHVELHEFQPRLLLELAEQAVYPVPFVREKRSVA